MGQAMQFLSRRKLSGLEIAEARDRIGPATSSFTDDELQHMFHEFNGASSNTGRMNKKAFQQYITSLKVFRRASKDEQFDPLFRAFDRGCTGDHITWLDFLDYHTAMKFGHPGAAAKDAIALASESGVARIEKEGQTSNPVSPASGPSDPFSTLNNASVAVGMPPALVAEGDGELDLEDERDGRGELTEAAYARRHRRLLGQIIYDMFVEGRRPVLSRQDLARVLRRTTRWVTDESDVRDDLIDAHVAALFKEARVPRITNTITREAFIGAFLKHKRFALHIAALI
jgi:hypothetical protein